MRLLRGPPADQDRVDALVGLLEKRLFVETGEGTISIAVLWNNAPLAYRLVEAAQQNFLEARHVSEISTISETISILEGHAAAVRDLIESDVEELQKAQEAAAGKTGAPPLAAPAAAKKRAVRTMNQELLQVRLMLLAKRRAIADLEEFRRKRLAELQAELTRQLAIYADQHPIVVDTKQVMDALLRDSPQIVSLHKDQVALEQDYLRRGGKLQDLEGEIAEIPEPRAAAEVQRVVAVQALAQDNPALVYLRNRLQFSLSKYSGLLDRIDSAGIELDTARAAFKYRYSVIRPPQIPRAPEKPNASFVLGAAAVAGMFLAMIAAIAVDLASGVLFEPWQVERELHLPVLSMVRRR